MARMFPDKPSVDTRSNAERKLFERFRTELSDEWVILHSVGLAAHATKRWGQVDFITIGPSGVFCLEVKGGRVDRIDGIWRYTNRNGRVNKGGEGPFDQAGGAEAALRRYLRDQNSESGSRGRFTMGWGVMTPDIRFSVSGPDIESAVIYDAVDDEQPMTKYFDRLSEHWRERILRINGSEPVGLRATEVDRLRELLRRDFELTPILRADVRQVTEQLVRLTEEQQRALQGASSNDRVLVRGGAGTGKTVLALADARAAAEHDQHVIILCFSAALGHQLAGALESHTNATGSHLHGWMRELVKRAGLTVPDVSPADLNAVFLPELAYEAVAELGLEDSVDLIILDEAQDLMLDPYLDVLDAVLVGGLHNGRWRAFYDPNQNIFAGTAPKAFHRIMAPRPAEYELTINCRNTIGIATETAILAECPLPKVLGTEGPDVVHCYYRDAADLNRQVTNHLNRLLSQDIGPSDIVVLSPRRLENSLLRSPLEAVSSQIADLNRFGVEPGAIGYSTVQAFKGLEADAVVLIDVDDLDTPSARAAVYVGSSRARVLLAVFLAEETRDQFHEHARNFGRAVLAGPKLDT